MADNTLPLLCTLTVFFEEPFWVGVFERLDERGYAAARVVFGGEPSNPEVYTTLLGRYRMLEFSAPQSIDKKPAQAANFKRRQREARRAAEAAGVGTKAQEALRLELEKNKQERRLTTAEERREIEQRKFELRQERKREKHRGR